MSQAPRKRVVQKRGRPLHEPNFAPDMNPFAEAELVNEFTRLCRNQPVQILKWMREFERMTEEPASDLVVRPSFKVMYGRFLGALKAHIGGADDDAAAKLLRDSKAIRDLLAPLSQAPRKRVVQKRGRPPRSERQEIIIRLLKASLSEKRGALERAIETVLAEYGERGDKPNGIARRTLERWIRWPVYIAEGKRAGEYTFEPSPKLIEAMAAVIAMAPDDPPSVLVAKDPEDGEWRRFIRRPDRKPT